MQGRSQQKTQQMGQLELRGRQLSGMRLVESRVDAAAAEESIFDNIDTSINGIAAYEPDARADFAELLDSLGQAATAALANYDALEPTALIPVLSDGLGLARAARGMARSTDARRLLDEKTEDFENALILAAGISIDALTDAETVVPGGRLQVAVRIFDVDSSSVRPGGVSLTMPVDWTSVDTSLSELANESSYRRRDQADAEYFFDVNVPADAIPTQPYWLEAPRHDFLYDWSRAGSARNQPFGTPLLIAVATIEIGGEPVTIEKEVQYRFADRVRGEIRRRLDVVPAVSLESVTDLLIVPISSQERRHELLLTVRNNAGHEVSGTARFKVPAGWALEPASAVFSLPASPASMTLAFNVTLPDEIAAGNYRLGGTAMIDGVTYRQSMREVAYPHIQTHRVYEPAATEFEIIDVTVAPVRIGYVMGSGDQVPEALRRLGVEVMLLDDAALTSGDLSPFDTIVIGIRASQTRPAFVANNAAGFYRQRPGAVSGQHGG
jgi:hypothetical protein